MDKLRKPPGRPPGPGVKQWVSGPDPLHHKMYIHYNWHRGTSRRRGETWHLTWEQWRDTWLPHWSNRGRAYDQMCMSRRDYDLPWSTDNIEIITRREHGVRVRELTR